MKNNKKNHIKLLSDIGEISDLFSDANSLEAFLQKIVLFVSEHMTAEVCSIYLFDEVSQRLVLRATKGLFQKSVGEVFLGLGEGLCGLALKELRPICEKRASQNANYKFFPGIGEEKFDSFLAVPILRGKNRVGIIVVQNKQKNFFDEEDMTVLKVITSQLANTIEMARLLMGLNKRQEFEEADQKKLNKLQMVKGKVGSSGIAYAQAVVKPSENSEYVFQGKVNKRYTKKKFLMALKDSEAQLEKLQEDVEEKLYDVASLIFTAQILILKDPEFIEAIIHLIEEGINPPEAIINVVNLYVEKFKNIPDAYLRERLFDVKDLGSRLLRNLLGTKVDHFNFQNKILIAEELFPTDILKLSSQKIKGVILLSGGTSSHLAILSRSLKLPMIISQERALLSLPQKTKILLDAQIGNIYINPKKDVLESFKAKQKVGRTALLRKKPISKPITTKDGYAITLMANINLLGDVEIAVNLQADGVGLYRTEFPFIVRSDFPAEEEQFVIYKRLMEGISAKEISFRTLDIGGDKILSYYDHGQEENPFLGMRSIRFSLRHKEIFKQQIRAILRAGVNNKVRIMFPMISSVDEFLEAKMLVNECIDELKKKGIPCLEKPLLGLMVELPSVLDIIEELACVADFFSIGTNDFIQYTLAVDRTNEKVSDLYLPCHPSVLRGLNRIVSAAEKFHIDVSVCGDMAHEKKYLSFLIGIGIKKLSVDPIYLPILQDYIPRIRLESARKKAEKILTQSKICDMKKFFKSV